MKKRKLKPFVLPTVYVMLVSIFGLFTYLLANSMDVANFIAEKNYTYVSHEVITNNTIPVISVVPNKNVIKPFTDDKVTVAKDFYDKDDTTTNQENAIIFYNGTYIQNSGITYTADVIFNCLSVLDGEVIDIKEDDIVGKSVTIRHNNELISVYQNLSEVEVKMNDKVSQGDIIGVSGNNSIIGKEGYFLHFELIYNDENINPENYYGKTIGE